MSFLRDVGRQFIAFVGVGGTATALQYLMLILLVEFGRWDPVWASATGYGCSAALNYYLNHRLTFKSSVAHRVALPRFCLTVTGGLLLNTLFMHLLVQYIELNYVLAQVISTGLVLIYNFFFSRVWVYQPTKGVGQ
jgi:putative flippase GtrA